MAPKQDVSKKSASKTASKAASASKPASKAASKPASKAASASKKAPAGSKTQVQKKEPTYDGMKHLEKVEWDLNTRATEVKIAGKELTDD